MTLCWIEINLGEHIKIVPLTRKHYFIEHKEIVVPISLIKKLRLRAAKYVARAMKLAYNHSGI